MCENCNCGKELQTMTISIEGMSCGHCKKAVEAALKTLDGVCEAEVNLDANSALVAYEKGKVTEEKIKDAVVSAGYEVK
ncbi:copper ion binding protein [Desulfitibacter alkalitolerans]|uniref:copper ion binding protein n=1 Tax=Desulfitibacter alkalitolerans TaxID=264641 RepID=UPI0012EC7CAA